MPFEYGKRSTTGEVFTFDLAPSSRLGVTLSERPPRGPFVASLPASRRVATPEDRDAHGSWRDYGGAFAPAPARSTSVRRRRRRGRGTRGALRRASSA